MSKLYFGWTVNLSSGELSRQIGLPVPPLFQSSQGAVIEVVMWSPLAERWVHCVSEHFGRRLPAGHVQVTPGDTVWLSSVRARWGEVGLRHCVLELEQESIPYG